jgi:predicted nucleic acid-binding protein
MRAPVTVLDACVLYPAAIRDLMMRMTLAGLIDARWTSTILPDPDDRHVVAAAIEADADWIVT